MFNQIQIRIINQTIANWRRALLSAKSEDERKQIETEIKLLEEKLEDDRRERNQKRNVTK